MLKGITWGQFSVFILVVAGGYYLYVFMVYYRTEALGWLARKRGTKDGGKKGAEGDGRPAGESEPKATGSQAELYEKEKTRNGGGEQFQAMQRAITVIRQAIAQGIENKLDRENLLDHIKEVLGNYRQLRKTEYAETINNFLIRVCSSELSLEVGEGDLVELWK